MILGSFATVGVVRTLKFSSSGMRIIVAENSLFLSSRVMETFHAIILEHPEGWISNIGFWGWVIYGQLGSEDCAGRRAGSVAESEGMFAQRPWC